jgi:prolyl oligopeptidase
MSRTLKVGIVLAALAMTAVALGPDPLVYPPTRRGDQVDDYHGTKVPDPYRWLEDDVRTSKAVADWVAAENKLTNAYLEAIPQRGRIRARLAELWDYARYTRPFKAGGRYVFGKNDGLQNQPVLYAQDTPEGQPRVLLDPNTWSKDGTVALGTTEASDDGRLLAYAVAEAGSDWNTWRVLDIATGKPTGDEVRWAKFSRAAWTKDSKGFFYGRYDEPKTGEKFQTRNLNQKVFYHKLGTPQKDDELIYRRPDNPDWGFQPDVTEDGRYLLLTVWKGTDDRYRIIYFDLEAKQRKPVELIDNFDNDFTFVGNDGPVFYFQTDLKAPRGRVIAIDLRKPERKEWKEVLPQADESLRSVRLVGGRFLAVYLKDARTQVKVFERDGTLVREVDLPGLGTASGFTGKQKDGETFYTFSSYATPPAVYHYDVATGKSTLFGRGKVKFNPDDYEVKQVFYPSKDGTRVPMFITAKKGLKLGNNPTLLYGYGGFNIPMTPEFSASRLAWMEMGGVYAVANLRGGGEYGQEWHKAGTKEKKQNVFDDFLAAAEWLVREKYTRPGKLAIEGRSNGGLLVGACMTQRPELFGACLPGVGVMDMLRFHKFTIGHAWVDDYGSSDEPAEFKTLYAYSPYHNLKKGTKYPATLVTTADTDDRVVPGHSFKFIAELQYCQGGPAPVLARIETRAGHGAGKPTAMQIDEVADQIAFLVKNLDMKLP